MRDKHFSDVRPSIVALIHLVTLPMPPARPSPVIVCIVLESEQEKYGNGNSPKRGGTQRVTVDFHIFDAATAEKFCLKKMIYDLW